MSCPRLLNPREWKIRGNKLPKGLPCGSKKQAEAIVGRMNQTGGDNIEIPEDEDDLIQTMTRTGGGYLIHKDSTTVLAITIEPTSEGGSDGGLLKITPGN